MEQPTKLKTNKRNPWWLFGAMGIFILTKLKALLPLLKLGSTGGTVVTMLISAGAYAMVFPAQMAIGLVAMLLVHELGHVIAAKRKGLPASAPVFIPFFGALINMRRNPRDAVTEAYIAIGGPLLGTLGALAAYGLGVWTGHPAYIAVAYIGFFLNLINLLPIHPLDGGRIAVAVSRWLWLAGLVGGLVVILSMRNYMENFIFILIWAMFAWDLYKKFVRRKPDLHHALVNCELEVEPLLAQGVFLPGLEHRRTLPFTTYSDLADGKQHVLFSYQELNLHERLVLPMQGLIQKVHVVRTERISKAVSWSQTEVPHIVVHCQIDYHAYENDLYYEVPIRSRWLYGVAYASLALFLLYMIHVVSGMGLPV